MRLNIHKITILNISTILVILTLLSSGCKGVVNSKKYSNDSLSVTNSSIINGNAILGPVSGATVGAYPISSSGTLDHAHLLASTKTDANGNYTLILPNKNLVAVPIGIQLSGGNYQEESSGHSVSLSKINLTAVLPSLPAGTIVNVAIGPLSEMAFQVFKSKINLIDAKSISISDHARNANVQVAQAFGLNDIIGTLPANPKGRLPNNSNGQYTVVLAALSQAAYLARTDSVALGAAYSNHLIQNGNLNNVGKASLAVDNADGIRISVTPPTLSNFSSLIAQIGNGQIPISGLVTDPNFIAPIMNSDIDPGPPKPTSQSCVIANGIGSQTWNGVAWGTCILNSCNENYNQSNNSCVPNISSQSCMVTNGSGSQSRNGSVWGACTVSSCNANYNNINNSCVAKSQPCSISNGSGLQTWAGSSWGTCAIAACNVHYSNINNICVANTQSCTSSNSTGTQTWNGSSWGTCNVNSCGANYSNVNNICVANTQSCLIANGSGSQTWNGSTWGTCAVSSCNSNYSKISNTCVANTQACSFANGLGSQVWNGSSWGACTVKSCNTNFSNVDKVCKEDTQSCSVSNGSGTQSLNSTICNVSSCNTNYSIVNNSCVANSQACSITNGLGSQIWIGSTWSACNVSSCNTNFSNVNNSCLPNSQVCSIANGTGSQSRNGSSLGTCIVSSCNANFNNVNNACVANTQVCSITNGIGTQIWNGSTWGTCLISSCNASFTQSGNNCVARTQTCSIANGSGSQIWNGTSWGTCNLVACNPSFHSSGNSCAFNEQGCALPPNAATAMQSWNGFTWGTCNITSCNTNYTNVNNSCVPPATTGLSSSDLAILQAAEAKFANTKYLVLAPLDPGSSESDFDYGRDMIAQLGTRGSSFLLSSGVLLYAFNETQYRIENKLLAAISDAEKNDLPLLIHVDFEWFIEGRPDLWNWFDPSQPGYNVQNKYNIEWSAWDQPTKKFWFNWGNPAAIKPKVCYSSPKIRQEMTTVANIISQRINTWRLDLARKQKSYLFAGVDVGWETGMPDLRNADWASSEKDNLGYCTLHHRGFSAQNPPANFEVEVKKAVKDFVDFETQIFSNNSIPKSKIFTHIAGFDGIAGSPFPQRSPLSAAFNSNSTPGFSLYLNGSNQPLYDDQLLQNSVKGQPWAIVESPTTRNVVRYLADPNLKLISFFSWGFDIKANAPVGDWRANQSLVKEILNYNGGPTSGEVRGHLDNVSVVNGKTYVSGWACNAGVNSTINIHIYAGGAYPAGNFLFQSSTNSAAETGVQTACGIGSPNPQVRFNIEIPAATAAQFQDQPIYIYGISLSGDGSLNKLIGNSGLLKLPKVTPATPTSQGEVRGYLDGVSVVGGKTYVSGWACNAGINSAIGLHIYAGGAYPAGNFLLQAATNLSADSGIQNACGISSPNPTARFTVEIPAALASQFQDQLIYIYGISLSGDGSLNKLIGNSGVLKLPRR